MARAPLSTHVRRLRAVPRERIRLYLATAGIVFISAACSAVLISIGMAQEAPRWWQTADWARPEVGRCAEELENRLLSNVYHARPAVAVQRAPGQSLPPGAAVAADQPVTWTIPVSAADANAWLNARLPKWIRSESDTFEWPEQIEELQVEFRDDRILVGVKVRYADSAQYLSATLQPAIRETDGSLWMPAQAVSIGRLPLPASWFLSPQPTVLAQDQIPEELRELPETKSIAQVFSGQIPVTSKPIIKLADGRRVRLLSLTSRDGTLHVTCRTEPRETGSQHGAVHPQPRAD
jgi:hypothetical protein